MHKYILYVLKTRVTLELFIIFLGILYQILILYLITTLLFSNIWYNKSYTLNIGSIFQICFNFLLKLNFPIEKLFLLPAGFELRTLLLVYDADTLPTEPQRTLKV